MVTFLILDKIVVMRIPEEALVSWFTLLESSFASVLGATASEKNLSTQELGRITDNFLDQVN